MELRLDQKLRVFFSWNAKQFRVELGLELKLMVLFFIFLWYYAHDQIQVRIFFPKLLHTVENLASIIRKCEMSNIKFEFTLG